MKRLLFILSILFIATFLHPNISFADYDFTYDGNNTISFTNPGIHENYGRLLITTDVGNSIGSGPIYCNPVNNICYVVGFTTPLGSINFPNGVTNIQLEDIGADGGNGHTMYPANITNGSIPSSPYAPPYIHPLINTTIDQGGTFSIGNTYLTCEETTSCTITIDYGDGTGTQPIQTVEGSGTKIVGFFTSHYFNSNGTYNITISVTDHEGATTTLTSQVTIEDVSTNNYTFTYDGNNTLSFTNPGFYENYGRLIITTDISTTSSDGPIYCNPVSNICTATNFPGISSINFPNGITDIELEDMGLDGGAHHAMYPATITNGSIPNQPYAPPYIHPLINTTIDQCGTFYLNDLFTCEETTSCTVTIDYGDGTGAHPILTTRRTGTKIVSYVTSHYFNSNGTYNVTISVTDHEGSTTNLITPVFIENVSTINHTFYYDGKDTLTFTNPGFFPNYDRLVVTTDMGVLFTQSRVNCDSVSNICTAHDFYPQFNSEGTDFPVGATGIQLQDLNEYGAGSHDMFPATIITQLPTSTPTPTPTATPTPTNAAPHIVGVTSSPTTIQKGSSTTATGTFTDTNTGDTHTASWNWGDGNTTTGTVTEPNGSTPGSVTGSHTYTALGSYIVNLTITDNGGLSSNSQVVVAVIPTNGLHGSNLSHTNYTGANLAGQDISNANLSVATFNNVDFQSANLSQVNGSNSTFTNDNFTSANLNKVNFSNSNLTGSNFTNAIVTQANLSNANLTNVDFTGADLQGANLSGTTKTGIIWSNTTCPNGTNSNNHNNSCIGQGGGL